MPKWKITSWPMFTNFHGVNAPLPAGTSLARDPGQPPVHLAASADEPITAMTMNASTAMHLGQRMVVDTNQRGGIEPPALRRGRALHFGTETP